LVNEELITPYALEQILSFGHPPLRLSNKMKIRFRSKFIAQKQIKQQLPVKN
jgi:hypothetical protein